MNKAKMINLLQFARKAGKLVSGYDATIRALNRDTVHLVVSAEDSSERTLRNLEHALEPLKTKVKHISFGSQNDLALALGLPETAVFGVLDKNFAGKIVEYWQAED
ncbi:MAG: ribosomal L7Ae/L30e/S12e/Gadd45 family protein [Candidatus Cloacimonadota bacterium]